MLTVEETKQITKKFGKNEADTGSTAVQVALLTYRINRLAPHFEQHDHDYHSNRGLMKMIGQRRNMLRYLQRVDKKKYEFVLNELGLRK